ncbi:MAG: DUF4397 domain-containing protein [Flavobacteriales bacterium]
MKLTSTLVLLFAAIVAIAQPTNDSPCNAILVEVDGALVEGNNADATADPNEAVPAASSLAVSCYTSWCNDDVAVQNSMWYTFTAPANGAVVISTCNTGSALDSQIALWSASDCSDYSTFTNLAANDDIEGGCNDGGVYSSAITIDGLTPGAVYLIQVDGWDGEFGPFVLSVSTGQPTALVNFIHVSGDPLLGAVDVRLDGELLLDNFAYLTCSQYLPIDATGPHTISIHPPTSFDASDAIISTEVNFNSALNYEVAIVGQLDELGFSPYQPLNALVFEGAQLYSTEAGSIPMHFLHAVSDAPNVNFYDNNSNPLCFDFGYATFNNEGYAQFYENFTLSIFDVTGIPLGLEYCIPAAFVVDYGAGFTIVAAGFVNPQVNSNGNPFGLYLVNWNSGELIPLDQGACQFPDNDNICTATELVMNAPETMGDNSFATLEDNEASPFNLPSNDPESDCILAWCDGTLDNTLWYSFTATASGCVAINTCFADGVIDTQIALCEVAECTDPSAVSYLASNDDMEAACVGNTYSSYLEYCGLTPGETYYIQLDGYEGELGIFYIQITEPSMVGNREMMNVTGYPNPASDRIYFNGISNGAEIQVVSITGEVVLSSRYSGAGIDTSTLATGSYHVRIMNDGEWKSSRFMKL